MNTYPYCGHSVVMGKKKRPWQDVDYVLGYFGRSVYRAKKAYLCYVEVGLACGRRDELTGGGLIRSLGRWAQVISARRHGDRELSDERILGSGEFVEQVIKEADDRLSLQLEGVERKKKVEEIVIAQYPVEEKKKKLKKIKKNTYPSYLPN